MSRKEQLEEMLAKEPNDIFLRYGLAMEYKNDEEFEKSEVMFRELMAGEPPYVPAFFMLGQQLVTDDNVDESKAVLEEGIRQATAQGEMHAAGEMMGLLQSL